MCDPEYERHADLVKFEPPDMGQCTWADSWTLGHGLYLTWVTPSRLDCESKPEYLERTPPTHTCKEGSQPSCCEATVLTITPLGSMARTFCLHFSFYSFTVFARLIFAAGCLVVKIHTDLCWLQKPWLGQPCASWLQWIWQHSWSEILLSQ